MYNPLSKKAQSALEYMMTYGWAILIIVIVAVILYSMGIFNPSSSVTATSSGFSPFTPSSAICTTGPGGYSKISFVVGGLPNGASSVTIDKLYLTSPSGFSSSSSKQSTYVSPTTVRSGQTFIVVVPGASCSSIGVTFSSSAKLQYSYSTPAGNVNANATGTIAGKASVATSPDFALYVNNLVYHPFWFGVSASNSIPFGWSPQGGLSYMNATQSISGTNKTFTLIMWVKLASPYPNISDFRPIDSTDEYSNPYTPNSSMAYADSIGLFGFNSYTAVGIGKISYNDVMLHRCSKADTNMTISPVSFFDGKWTFIAVSVKAPEYYAQIDGNSNTSINEQTYSQQSEIRIGDEFQQCDEAQFVGYISNVQLYNISLSSTQLEQAYKNGITAPPIVTNSSLVAWWNLNGTTKDFSGHGYNGQLVNASFASTYS